MENTSNFARVLGMPAIPRRHTKTDSASSVTPGGEHAHFCSGFANDSNSGSDVTLSGEQVLGMLAIPLKHTTNDSAGYVTPRGEHEQFCSGFANASNSASKATPVENTINFAQVLQMTVVLLVMSRL